MPVSTTVATISAGERLTLRSEVLGENRTVFVSLPDSYSRGDRRYPVLYLTDAQWNFDHTRSSVGLLARNRIIPEMIVVGVTNTDRTRDLYATKADFKRGELTIPFPTSGNADRFLEFFTKELIPWTEATYRTSPLRILAGHSAGGNFALHAMRTTPGVFQAIMVASPWLAWDDHKELKELVAFLKKARMPVRSLFFTSAPDDGPDMAADIQALTGALRTSGEASLRWASAEYPSETHDSVVLKSYYDALLWIFAGWNYPRDPQTNALKGSLDDVKDHYKRLEQQLGVTFPPPIGIVNTLGYQYLRANNLDLAITAFRFNTKEYPRSADAWVSLGEGLERAGKMDEALASYRQALSIAEANNDPNLENFRKRVASLTDRLKSNPK